MAAIAQSLKPNRVWFDRSSMNPELEKQVFTKSRRRFHDENGEDMRLKKPGVNWSLVNNRRYDIFDDFSKKLEEMFETFHEKINKTSHSRKSITPVLPTAKTPSVSKIRSRLTKNNQIPVPEPAAESASIVTINSIDTVPEQTKKPAGKRGQKRKQTSEAKEEQPRRLTRQQAKKKVQNPCTTRRATRSMMKGTHLDPEPVVALKSSLVGVESEEVIVIQDNSLSRRVSSVGGSRASLCQISLEKVSIATEPQTKDTNAQDGRQMLAETGQTSPPSPTVNVPTSSSESDKSGSSDAPVTPNVVAEVEVDVEVSLAKPTPPRKKTLKLKRKKGPTKSRAAQLREQETTGHSTEDIPIHCNLPPTPPAVCSSKSTESVYESCVSQLEVSPMAIPSSLTVPALVNPQLLLDDEDSVSTPETFVETPITAIKLFTDAAPGRTDAGGTPSLDNDLVRSEAPVRPAPCVTPSYLTGTPRTLTKLREEYQSRNGGKVVSLSELLSSGGRTPLLKKTPKPSTSKTTGSKTPLSRTVASPVVKATAQHAELPAAQEADVVFSDSLGSDTPLMIGKRLRSVSIDKLTHFPPSKSPKTSTLYSSESSQEDNYDTPNEGEDSSGSGSDSPFYNCVLEKKLTRHPITFLKKKAVAATKDQQAQLMSFLPRMSPKKPETKEAKKAQLANKMLRKREEQAKRQANLKSKRQQELQDRIKKREEKARKVAENQAALKLQEEEKKKKLKGRGRSGDLLKMANSKKANEIKEKNKKLNERMQAAEARRKQDALQQEKRHQQLEEERRLAVELAAKRRELEEEEKRIKRQEKLKHRHQKPPEEPLTKPPPDPPTKSTNETATTVNKHEQLLNQLEKVIGGAIAKVPVIQTPKVSRLVSQPKTNPDKTNKLLQAYWNGNQTSTSNKDPSMSQTTPLSPADSRLNSTFTKATPLNAKMPVSYQMTPDDPINAYDNYDINDLSSTDSTDDEDEPKKALPLWARPECLRDMMVSQEDAIVHNKVDVNQIFPPHQLLKDPDLAKIFRRKRPRFYKRTSSAQWNSPIIKKNRIF